MGDIILLFVNSLAWRLDFVLSSFRLFVILFFQQKKPCDQKKPYLRYQLNNDISRFIYGLMAYIQFDKTQLVNLEYSLNREMVRSNLSGAFSCTSIIGCNTRKYHGLLITSQPQLDGDHHVLLSQVDETVIQRDAEFNLGVSKFADHFFPKGHKYIRDFSTDLLPVVTYRVGGVLLTRETMFVSDRDMVMIRYTLLEARSATRLRLQPFLAFRNMHELSKANAYHDTNYEETVHGIRVRMYDGYPWLYMQLSGKSANYYHGPQWHHGLHYYQEEERGYEATEDLLVPGIFETDIRKGESIIFCVSTTEAPDTDLQRLFDLEISKRIPRDSFLHSLRNAAAQFFVVRDDKASLVAGFPWISYSGRYTWIALPGLLQAAPKEGICQTILDHMLSQMSGPLFPESYFKNEVFYNSADTSLWFFHALPYCAAGKSKTEIWNLYGEVIRRILDGYATGLDMGVQMHDNGLLFIDPAADALTWMNTISDGRCNTPRTGYVVEINALWYNALKYALELAYEADDHDFTTKWQAVVNHAADAFVSTFWSEQEGYLADYVLHDVPNMQIRPNQVIAVGLSHTPLNKFQIKSILDLTTHELLTPRGLRSLSPKDPQYRGRYQGDALARDTAYHQGTVWVWPLGFYAHAWHKVYGEDGMKPVQKLFEDLEPCLTEAGVGTISEIYEGDPPHHARGAISFAASLGEVLRMQSLIFK